MKRLKNSVMILLIVTFAAGIQSCKKSSSTDETTADDSSSQMQHSSDEAIANAESDQALNDINTAVSVSAFGKSDPIAGAHIDSIAPKKLSITYSGHNADGTRTRSGQITVELTSGNHWSDAGAVLTITFSNIKITRNTTGKSITINGTHVVTNTTGGLVGGLTPGNSLTHVITGDMVITFDDGMQRTWFITRTRKIGLTTGGAGYVEIGGNGSDHKAVAGTNRAGALFTTLITTPVLYSSTYGWLPVSGVKVHKGLAREITVTFGVDANGTPANGVKPYGYKIQWTNVKGEAKQAVISY